MTSKLGITPGINCIKTLKSIDETRIKEAEKAVEEIRKKCRKTQQLAKRKLEDQFEEQEDPNQLSYGAGMEEPVRTHLKNVYACLTMSTVAAAVGAYVHMYTELLSAGLLTVIAAVGFLFALMSTPDNGKNRQMRIGFLLGFAFFSGNILPCQILSVATAHQSHLGTAHCHGGECHYLYVKCSIYSCSIRHKLGNLMDVQEQHITNGGVHYLGVKVLAGLDIRVCHPLVCLNGGAGSVLAPSSSKGTILEIRALNSSSWISTGGRFYPHPYPSRISCHSGSSTKVIIGLGAIYKLLVLRELKTNFLINEFKDLGYGFPDFKAKLNSIAVLDGLLHTGDWIKVHLSGRQSPLLRLTDRTPLLRSIKDTVNQTRYLLNRPCMSLIKD
ncbi:Bax inhibitor 1 [Homalodisca vitripennis]|nr:Bax inhibitor 1 [Homalodisca vitripennis]